MAGEAIEKKLFDVATTGDVTTLKVLLQEDPYLLHGVSFACSRNLLHVATMHGQRGVVENLMGRNPQLARELDSNMSSPLHIATAHKEQLVDIAWSLIDKAPEVCWWRDCHGMNPVHIAAMNGHVEILKELIEKDKLPAMERAPWGQTVLHLCVKHRRLPALKFLVEKLEELVEAKDDCGDTLLHLAARSNDLETIKYLLKNEAVKKPTRNSMGKTALQIFAQSPGTAPGTDILALLKNFPAASTMWNPKRIDMMMVVLVLIATMAFQAAVSPPGGVWQDNTPSHRAGQAVMATTHPRMYTHFLRANTTAFALSVAAIFIMTTVPLQSVVVMGIASWAEAVSLAAISVSYVASKTVITPNTETKSPGHTVTMVVTAALGIYGFTTMLVLLLMMFPVWRRVKQRPQQQDQSRRQRHASCLLSFLLALQMEMEQCDT